MDVISKLNGLIREAKKGIQFNRMPKLCKIIIIIGLIPLIVSTFSVVSVLWLTNFIYTIIFDPVEYLYNLLKAERDKVKHATQVFLYLISWPIVFLMFIYKAVLSIVINLQWLVVMIHVYLVTLGGVSWQPFISSADFTKDDTEYELKPKKFGLIIFTVLIAIFDFLFALGLYGLSEYNYSIDMVYEMELFTAGYIGIILMLYIINPILFKKIKTEVKQIDDIENIE